MQDFDEPFESSFDGQNDQSGYDLSVTNDEFWGVEDHAELSRRPFKILFFGDSILSGYGLNDESEGVANVIDEMFKKSTYIAENMIFRNMSVPGETTSGAVTRIKYAIKRKPDVLVLAIGGNDALRGVDPDILYNNLNIMLRDLSRSGIYTLFVGMQASPSLGYTYMSKFNSVYAKLSESYPVLFMPFLLEDVAGNKALNQRDGIHPNAQGHEVIAKNMTGYIGKMVKNVRRARHDIEEKEYERNRMIQMNKALAAQGRKPQYTQQEIDAMR